MQTFVIEPTIISQMIVSGGIIFFFLDAKYFYLWPSFTQFQNTITYVFPYSYYH